MGREPITPPRGPYTPLPEPTDGRPPPTSEPSDGAPTPKPSTPTRPKLTRKMLAVDAQFGGSKPGAGGWTPTKLQLALLSAFVAGALATFDLLGAPDVTTRVALLAGGKAAIGAIATYLTGLSAGNRKVSP